MKAMILFSGGLDSTTALLKGRKEQIQNGSYDEKIKIAEGELKY